MVKDRTWRIVKLVSELKAREMFEGEVKKFGGGSAHIPFSVDYVGKKVMIIPLEEEK